MSKTGVFFEEVYQGRIPCETRLAHELVCWLLLRAQDKRMVKSVEYFQIRYHYRGLMFPLLKPRVSMEEEDEFVSTRVTLRYGAVPGCLPKRPEWTHEYLISTYDDLPASNWQVTSAYRNRASAYGYLLNLARYGPVEWDRKTNTLVLGNPPPADEISEYLWALIFKGA